MQLMDRFTGELVEGAFQTQRFRKPTCKKEKVDEKSITETAYIPPEVQIRDMMQAGLRLAEERRQRFDSTILDIPDDEEPPLDPTREQGVDLVDIQRAVESVEPKLKAAKAAKEAKVKEEANAKEKIVFEKAVQEEVEKRAEQVKTV